MDFIYQLPHSQHGKEWLWSFSFDFVLEFDVQECKRRQPWLFDMYLCFYSWQTTMVGLHMLPLEDLSEVSIKQVSWYTDSTLPHTYLKSLVPTLMFYSSVDRKVSHRFCIEHTKNANKAFDWYSASGKYSQCFTFSTFYYVKALFLIALILHTSTPLWQCEKCLRFFQMY